MYEKTAWRVQPNTSDRLPTPVASFLGEDVKRVLNKVDELKIIEILALKPTVAEPERAAV